MSDRTKALLLDVGNTSIKYSLFYIGETEKNLNVNVIRFENLHQIIEGSRFVLICSVKQEAFNNKLSALLSKYDCKYEFIHTQRRYRSLINSYENVSNMGGDRWVGMIGAQTLVGDSFLLVDAGTAITIDVVHKQQHLGGWIVAGKRIAKDALLANTDRVFDSELIGDTLAFGKDTPDCVQQGSSAMATGVVLVALELLKDYNSTFVTVVSGGDAALIASNLKTMKKTPIFETNNIVLTGLASIANHKFSV